MSNRIVSWAQVDVFAENPLEGNQLAIFPHANGLTTEQMQAIARETNLSETTFIFHRDEETERERGVKVRIFTTQEELPFAGHPTLGTASWLYWNHPHFQGYETITLDLPVGPVPVTFTANSEHPGVFGEMTQRDPEFGNVHDKAAVARAIGLDIEDLDPELPVETVSTGMAFCIVPLRSLEVAAKLAIPQREAQAYLNTSDAKFFYCITPGKDADWHARMQFYNGEDPATGSASGCAISYLVRHRVVEPNEQITLEQGVEMKRPSLLSLRANRIEGRVCEVRVAGRTIEVAKGHFFLPD